MHQSTHMHACTCVHTHTHAQMCIHTHIHTLTCLHTHAHIYSFVHMINGSVSLARCCYMSCSAPCPVLFFPFCSVVPLITIGCGFEWFCMWHARLALAVDWEPPVNHCTCRWERSYLLLSWTYWVGWMCELGWVMAVFCPAVSCFCTDSSWHAFNTLAKLVNMYVIICFWSCALVHRILEEKDNISALSVDIKKKKKKNLALFILRKFCSFCFSLVESYDLLCHFNSFGS